jgi:hypothetical protein
VKLLYKLFIFGLLNQHLYIIFKIKPNTLQNKDYTQLSLEALQAEEKKIKKELTIRAFFIGMLIGIIIFSVVRNGFRIFPMLIPTILIFMISRNSQKLKFNLHEVRKEMGTNNKS